MKLITVVDDNMGLMFNNRRQSQDRILRAKILKITVNSLLFMNPYSFNQFKYDNASNIITVHNPLECAKEDDYVFIENDDVKDYENKLKKIYLFRWNRNYPADKFLSIDFNKYRLEKTEEFEGSSHDKITMEVYNAQN